MADLPCAHLTRESGAPVKSRPWRVHPTRCHWRQHQNEVSVGPTTGLPPAPRILGFAFVVADSLVPVVLVVPVARVIAFVLEVRAFGKFATAQAGCKKAHAQKHCLDMSGVHRSYLPFFGFSH